MSENQENFSFVETEKKIQKFWKENKIFEKSLEKTKDKDPYIFYDGPPFATGLPHHGHLVASTLKDIVPRYFTMKGRYVSRRWGWDTHGLPIEQQIDKKFGMSANDYVEQNGIKTYCDACREIVLTYTSQWQHTIERMGRWVDFEKDYKTMDKDFMESVWWVFKECWDKGLIYQGNKIVPYSPALETGLSNFEATSNYQDVQDPAVTILFKIKDKEGYFSAWTTTPWTLPSNLGLIVNEDIDYLFVHEKTKDVKFYIAKERLESYKKGHDFEVLSECKGKDLVGLEYEPLFPYFEEKRNEGAFKVIADDYVTTSDGTGIVHSAPAFGEDDNRVMKAHGIDAIVCPLNSKAEFTSEVSDFAGKYIKDADKEIIKKLKDNGQLFHQSVLVHSYPFCYRTDTPLIYMAMPQWYLSVDTVKEKMLNANDQIHWVPGHIKAGRFGKWLEGARDWAISRNRFWGTPLPVWMSADGEDSVCIGSIEELAKYTGKTVDDLHRETVDELTFEKDGKTFKRIPEVFDCWFESGSMPYAQIHYPFENKEVFEKGFPAEFIAEGLDQTRGWFYTLTVLSAALYDKPAFKNVIVNGMVMAADGKKMSKRLQNYTAPDVLMEQFGADALRLTFITSGLVKGEELRFTDEGVKDMVRRALLPWYNSFKFFHTYAKVDGFDASKHLKHGDNILDRWILSELQTLIKNVNHEMDGYRLYNVVPQLFHFIEDLTNWYIRLNRRRFWEGKDLTDDKCAAYSTLYTALRELSKIMAPFAPFLSEHIYQELKENFGEDLPESVHLCDYPEFDESYINDKLEDAVIRMQELILLGRQKRSQADIKVKTPLANLTVIHQDQALLNEIKHLEDFIKVELNVKNVSYDSNEDNYIKLYAKPNARVLGKKVGKRFKDFMASITKIDSATLKEFEAKGELILLDKKLIAEDIFVYREAQKGSNALSNRWISVDLDVNLNPELINEGLAREVVNRVQRSRKDLNFNVEDRIVVTVQADEIMKAIIDQFQDYIKAETLTTDINFGVVNLDEPNSLEHKIDKFVLKTNLRK